MQRVIRRTALARNQAQRKAIRGAKEAEREELNDALRQRFAHNRMELDAIRAERQRRREDWMRGPLAPRRDAGPEGKLWCFESAGHESARDPETSAQEIHQCRSRGPGVCHEGKGKGQG